MRKGLTSTSKSGLSKQQLDAIKLIASGSTTRYAALVLKIKHSEIRKWLRQDEEFKSELAKQIEKLRNDESREAPEIKQKKKSA